MRRGAWLRPDRRQTFTKLAHVNPAGLQLLRTVVGERQLRTFCRLGQNSLDAERRCDQHWT
jgi:hypothetical protein